jgi:hypothetical protein
MAAILSQSEQTQLMQTIEMFEVITQTQSQDYQSLEILKEAYSKLGRDQDVVNTSKRIAEAYVQLGQFSSAILEYETILQRHPEHPEVQAALKEIETKASSFPAEPSPMMMEEHPEEHSAPAKLSLAPARSAKVVDMDGKPVEDGRDAMGKIFVESKIISVGDFDLCWPIPDLSSPPEGVVEPFVQVLSDNGILPEEKSLKLISDKSRTAFLPLGCYDLDLDLTRKFSSVTCQRWCVLPFDRLGKAVLIATANPFNQQAAKELAEAGNHRLVWYLATPAELVKNLRKAFR